MSERGRRFAAAILDAVTYAVAVVAITTLLSALVSFLLGHGLVGVKYGLFYLGFVVFLLAIVVSWPGSAWKDVDLSFDLVVPVPGRGSGSDDEVDVPWVDTEPSGESGTADQTVFQAFVQRLPPARFLPAHPAGRLPDGLRLFLAAIAVHGTSFALEVVFGVPG